MSVNAKPSNRIKMIEIVIFSTVFVLWILTIGVLQKRNSKEYGKLDGTPEFAKLDGPLLFSGYFLCFQYLKLDTKIANLGAKEKVIFLAFSFALWMLVIFIFKQIFVFLRS